MFENIDLFYLGLLLLTTVFCLRVNTQDSFLGLLMLWFLFGVAQFPEVWNYPKDMLYVHAGVFFISVGGFHNGISLRMQIVTTLMVLADALWVIFSYIDFPVNALSFPANIFWWQSVINILFMAMCLTLIVGCYTRMKIERYRKNHNGLVARVAEEITGGV